MKTVLITGSSTGFGREMVSEFLARGWNVIATLRNAHGRTELFEEERSRYGDRLRMEDLDVTRAGELEALVKKLEAEPGLALECLVNNAGYGLFGSLEDTSEEQLRQVMEVNFFGAAAVARRFMPLLRRSRGRLIFVSSAFGFVGFPLTSAYCASKFAIEGLAESVALEVEPTGVQVSIVEPGGFRTSFLKNTVWGQTAFHPSSPYLGMTESYRELREKRMEALPAGRPVTRAVVRLAEKRGRLPFRVRAGLDARAGWALRRLLPSFIFEPLYRAVVRRIFENLVRR